MTGRRLPNSLATVATAGRGADEEPRAACRNHRVVFEATIDRTTGPAAQEAVREAKRVCMTECPLLEACFHNTMRDHRGEPGVIAGLTHKERNRRRKPPTRSVSCGKPHGPEMHLRRGEASCDDCKAAAAKRQRERGKVSKVSMRHDARLGDLRDLIATGATLAEICARLDVNRDALWKWCKKWGHDEEWAAVSRPAKGNQYVKGFESITTRRRGKKVAA